MMKPTYDWEDCVMYGAPGTKEVESAAIIACHNYEKYVHRCIESCLAANPSEIIIADDASIDGSKEIILMFVETFPNVKAVFLNENYGQRELPLNYAIDMTKAKYVVTVDADDFLHDNYFDIVLPHFSHKTGVVRVSHMRWDPVGRALCGPREWESEDRVKDLLEGNKVWVSSCFKREAWESVGGFSTNEYIKNGYGDWEFWIKLAMGGWEFEDALYPSAYTYVVHPESGLHTMSGRNMHVALSWIADTYKDRMIEKQVSKGPLVGYTGKEIGYARHFGDLR